MSKTAYVFCEGGGNSLDGKVLGNLFDKLTIKPVLVPTGGKRGMPAFVQGYFAGAKVVTNKVYLAFRDRDFDYEVAASPALIPTEKQHIFASYRTTIENYLLDHETFFAFTHQNKVKGVNIDSILKAKQIFDEAALGLKFYSAARHALGAMRDKTVDFDTTWTKGSGSLPEHLDEASCKANSLALIQPSRERAAKLTNEIFEHHFTTFSEIFNDAFFQNSNYLTWFNGKDLMAAICQHSPKANFSHKLYYDFALSQFDFRKFPDLTELFDKLSNLS